MFGQTILLLVPHADDEVVAAAATILTARAEGTRIFAAYLTHGCVSPELLLPWQRSAHQRRIQTRQQEAQKVAAQLGLTPIFWSERPARSLWRNLPKVFAECRDLITRHSINQIWVPAYEGGNADHDGLNAVAAALANAVPNLSVLEFAEYNWLGGQVNPNSFPYSTRATVISRLSPMEQRRKQALYNLYASERLNLSSVGVLQESFRPLVEYDYTQPPHKGLLWYERFQWVPFPHASIDRTHPAQVSAAIKAFAAWYASSTT
jgi:LmbE family N-acetylglucosaminyl deacetylase